MIDDFPNFKDGDPMFQDHVSGSLEIVELTPQYGVRNPKVAP